MLKGHQDAVSSVAVAPDGSFVVTGSWDKTARIWDAFKDAQALIDQAKTTVPRCLTEAQRQTFDLAPTPPRWCSTMKKWPYDDTGEATMSEWQSRLRSCGATAFT